MSHTKSYKDNIFVKALIGAGILLSTMAVTVFSVSAIIGVGDDPLSSLGIGSIASVIISALFGGAIVSRMGGDRRLSVLALSSVMTVVLMLSLGFILSGGSIGGGAIINYVVYLALAILSSLFGRRRGGRRHGKRR